MGFREEVLVCLLIGLCLCLPLKGEGHLSVGYYKHTCPSAESIVKETVTEAFKSDSGILADFVRMHFHDCFVEGCDGSILLDSTPGNTAEKDSPINNPSLEGFDVIDKAKSRLEASCKGVVSCADIVAFAARDSLELSRGLHYEVPAGRRDGRVSKASEANKFLPPPTFNLEQLTKRFASKGLSQEEMVTLSGVHTIGKSFCSSFDSRLYNFSKGAKQDPTLDPAYAEVLKKQCPGGKADANISVPMDPTTPEVLDSNYYKNILAHKGLFTSDMALVTSHRTAAQVKAFAHNEKLFQKAFVKAIVKMGMIDVKTGKHGEIRRDCKVVN